MTDHWKIQPIDFTTRLNDDDFHIKHTLDIDMYVSKLMKGLREAEDDVAEPIVIDWLRGRGYAVEYTG